MDNPFFDRWLPVEMNESGNLPHLNQDGKMQFITYRLADSMPQELVADLKHRRQSFLEQHPRPWSPEVDDEYWTRFAEYESKALDKGYGECLLRKPQVRKVVENNLHKFDGELYDLVAYVIMPNHVHVLLWLYPGVKIENVMHSFKSYTSKAINRIVGRQGSLWQREYFDRIIRNRRHLDNTIAYILKNPNGLGRDTFSYYVAPGW